MFVWGKSRTIFLPSNTLLYDISRDGSKKFNIGTCEHMILGQLGMGARQAKNAPLCDTKVFSQVKAKKVLHMKQQWLSLSIFTRGPQFKENLLQIVSQSGRQCVSRKSWWREEIERCCGKSRAVGRLPSLGDSCCSVASQEHDSETIRTHSSTRPTFSSSDDHNDNNDSMTIMTAWQ